MKRVTQRVLVLLLVFVSASAAWAQGVVRGGWISIGTSRMFLAARYDEHENNLKTNIVPLALSDVGAADAGSPVMFSQAWFTDVTVQPDATFVWNADGSLIPVIPHLESLLLRNIASRHRSQADTWRIV